MRVMMWRRGLSDNASLYCRSQNYVELVVVKGFKPCVPCLCEACPSTPLLSARSRIRMCFLEEPVSLNVNISRMAAGFASR